VQLLTLLIRSLSYERLATDYRSEVLCVNIDWYRQMNVEDDLAKLQAIGEEDGRDYRGRIG